MSRSLLCTVSLLFVAGSCDGEANEHVVHAAAPGKPTEATPSTGSAADPAGARAAPRAPSTGKEAPKGVAAPLTPEEAARSLVWVNQEMKKPAPDCDRVVRTLDQAIPVAAPRATDKTWPYYHAKQRCGARTKRWKAVQEATIAMLPLGSVKSRPQDLIRAQIELGNYATAARNLDALGKKFPEAKAELNAARTFLVCRQESWKACLDMSDKGLALARHAEGALEGEAALLNRIFRGAALLYLGRLGAAEKEFDAVEKSKLLVRGGQEARARVKASLDRMRRKVVEARANRLLWDLIVQPHIPLGVYHLMGNKVAGAPVEIRFYNLGKAARRLRVEAQLTGVSDPAVKAVTLLPRVQRQVVLLVPPLTARFDPAKVRSQMDVQVRVKITEATAAGEVVLLDDSRSAALLPRDSLPLKRMVGADAARETFEYIGAWVTPNARAVEELLTAAKRRHPDKTFVGEQGPTIPQVRAIFEELKARGVTYVMDPKINSDLGQVQRTRLPTDVLRSTNAQCLEGTILFATLMEAAGLRPVVVMIPHHAFVGWHSTPDEQRRGAPPVVFVETTMVGNATFDQAVAHAIATAAEERKNGDFDRGASKRIELSELRAIGIQPQPTE